MSRVWSRSSFWVIALLAAFSVNAVDAQEMTTEPQTVEPSGVGPQELRQRLDSLLPLYQEAKRIAEEAALRREAIARDNAAPSVDSILIGGMHIVALPEQSELARALFTEAWQEYANFASSPALSRTFFSFQWATQFQSIYLNGPDHRRIEHRSWRSRAFVARSVRSAIGAELSKDLDEALLAEWAGGAVLAPTDLTLTYRELATIPSRISRACIERDPLACWGALGLDVEPEDLAAFYTPAERVAFVRRLLGRYSRTYATRPEFADCTIKGLVEHCDSLLLDRRRWGYTSLSPLGVEARMAMIWIAVEAGGQDAWARLIADPEATPSEALQAASQLTPKELGGLWREEIMQHRPLTYAGTFPVSWSALFWTLFCAALSLRSTRWRLG